MDFESFRQRVQDERTVRAQRDAAERNIPGERLRREIREAFARESARELREDRQIGVEPNAVQSTDAKRGECPFMLEATELPLYRGTPPVQG